MRSSPLLQLPSCMGDIQRWSCRCSSATGCTNRRPHLLLALPGVALESARQIEGVGTGRSEPDRDDNRLEALDRGEAWAHLGNQLVLCDKKKIPASMLRQTVGQFPLVFGKPALQLPFDRIKGVRVDVVDQRG